MIAIALPATACETSFVAVQTRPSAALLQPCQDPELVADPDTATREEIAVERVRVAQAYADCRDGKEALVRWIVRSAAFPTQSRNDH